MNMTADRERRETRSGLTGTGDGQGGGGIGSKAIAVLRLQARIAAAVAKRREEGFSGLEGVRRICLGRAAIPRETVVRWTGAWTAALSRLGWRGGCLRRSLIMAEVLRKEGYDARVVLGAARRGKGIRGHSWVEVEGEEIGSGSGGCFSLWKGGIE